MWCGKILDILSETNGHKLFATIGLRTLTAAGADAGIWPTQFNFRTGRGSADALFVARRMFVRGSLVFLAVDWAKDFDSILGVSKNRGIPKWMVYNGKPY